MDDVSTLFVVCTSGDTYPVHVQDVDVVGAELLQRVLNGEVHRLHVVPGVMDLLLHIVRAPLVVRRVLMSSISTRSHNPTSMPMHQDAPS